MQIISTILLLGSPSFSPCFVYVIPIIILAYLHLSVIGRSSPLVIIVFPVMRQLNPMDKWLYNYFQWDVITHPWNRFNGGLLKPSLKFGMNE